MPIVSRAFRALVVSTLVCSPVILQAQVPPLLSAPKAEARGYASEPYVIEQLRNAVRFEADGKGTREQTLRVRIQSESAVREFGLLVYPYMASFETLEVVYVRVRKSDGTVVETPASEIQELDSAVSRQAPMYTDQREKHIAVKSLGVGDILEVDVRWTGHDPIAPGHFWFDHNYFDSGICLDEQLEINVPAEVPVKVAASEPAPEVKHDGSRTIYTFRSSHQKNEVSKNDEDKIPAWEANFYGLNAPKVRLSSFASWADVGAWYGKIQQDRVQVTPRIRSTAEEIVKGKSTDEEKIRAIYEYVASRIRYIGIDLGAGRFTPHAAEDVLNNRYGDCKDKHTLFAALLEAVGLHAYPALISSKFKLDSELPTMSLFDHVISAIPQGDSYLFVDTTPEVAPFRLLLPSLRDRQALVIPGNSAARLVRTPANPPEPSRETFRMDGALNAEGTLDAKVRFEARGDSEIVLRLAYRNTPQNQWKDLTQTISSQMGFGGTVNEVASGQPERAAEPFWVGYDYHRTDYSDWKEHRITLPFPPMVLFELNEAQKKSKDALPLGSPQDVVYEASVRLPENVRPVTPPNVEEKNDFAEYTATYKFEGTELRGSRHLSIKMREVPGRERDSYNAFVKAIEDDEQRWIPMFVLEEQSTLRKGQALLKEGKTADAIALLEKAHSENKDDRQIALRLGGAYLRLPDESKAGAVFDALLANKTDAATLNSVAYEYAEANAGLDRATTYASRAVKETSEESMKASLDSATAPDFVRATSLAAQWDTLGWVKFRSGDMVSAEKYLESAWLLFQNGVVGEHLAEVYEKTGNKREAYRLCNLALEAPGIRGDPNTAEKLGTLLRRLGAPLVGSKLSGFKIYFPTDPGGAGLSEMRTFKLAGKMEFQGKSKLALIAIALENGQSVAKARYVSGDKELMPLVPRIGSIHFHQPFPDDSPARIFRAGWISCSKYTSECTLILFPVEDGPSYQAIKPE